MKSLKLLKHYYDKAESILFTGILLLVFLAIPSLVTIKQAANVIDLSVGIALLLLDLVVMVAYFIICVKIIKAIQDVLDDFKDKL